MSELRAAVVGAGLAGAEAADRLTRYGVAVDLYEMKPGKRSPAHHRDSFAELVCSNSLRSDRLENAVGLLKEEMRMLDSLILSCAEATRVPAGGALAVDREGFTKLVTERIEQNPLIAVHHEELTALPEAPAIVATGPLTSDALNDAIMELNGGLHFYDAAAPIVTYDSLDHTKVFRASRYDRGEDYLNCPMTREEYFAFYRALIAAETAPLHDFETPRVFEGCMPVEVMAGRGEMTLAYGPMKPVGLAGEDGKRPFAVVQLRQDDADGTLWNLVGFQTNLKFPEQKRVFGMIPGLENAEFARFGVMHRNTFLNSPGFLTPQYEVIERPGLFFAGQITGVEGYVESASSGLLAGIALGRKLAGMPALDFPASTAIGALGHYVAEYCGGDFQPMNVTFGILSPMDGAPRKKRERYQALAERALAIVKELKMIC